MAINGSFFDSKWIPKGADIDGEKVIYIMSNRHIIRDMFQMSSYVNSGIYEVEDPLDCCHAYNAHNCK